MEWIKESIKINQTTLTLNSMARMPFRLRCLKTSRNSSTGIGSRHTSAMLFSSRAAESEIIYCLSLCQHHMARPHYQAYIAAVRWRGVTLALSFVTHRTGYTIIEKTSQCLDTHSYMYLSHFLSMCLPIAK